MTLHLYFAHLPLVLIVIGAAADAAGALARNERLRAWAGSLLVLGAIAAMLALLTGAGAMSLVLSQPDPPYQRVAEHSQWAGAAIWPLAGAGVLRALWRRRLSGPHGWALLAAALISAAIVLYIGASGLAIAHTR
jgi:uncharacterized membrane protein